MASNEYIQLHPVKTISGVKELDTNTNLYPIIGADSFKGFNPENAGPDSFKVQEQLINKVTLKGINLGQKLGSQSLVGKGSCTIDLLNLLYPVGTVYISNKEQASDICPIQTSLGGVWKRIKDTFLYAKGDVEVVSKINASDEYVTATAGSKNSVVVAHTHSSSLAGSHTHTVNSKTITGYVEVRAVSWITEQDINGHLFQGENGILSTARYASTDSPRKLNHDGDGDNWVSSNKNYGDILTLNLTHTHTLESVPDHRHAVYAPVGASDGIGTNMPPYRTVIAWYRAS